MYTCMTLITIHDIYVDTKNSAMVCRFLLL